MNKLSSPSELPKLIETLQGERFYGALHIEFRHGYITRVVTEQSQVFENPLRPTERHSFKRNDSNGHFNP